MNKENVNNDFPLTIVCKENNYYDSRIENILKYLIENGADINKENGNGDGNGNGNGGGGGGETPLTISCNSGNEKMAKYLIDHGADVNKKK